MLRGGGKAKKEELLHAVRLCSYACQTCLLCRTAATVLHWQSACALAAWTNTQSMPACSAGSITCRGALTPTLKGELTATNWNGAVQAMRGKQRVDLLLEDIDFNQHGWLEQLLQVSNLSCQSYGWLRCGLLQQVSTLYEHAEVASSHNKSLQGRALGYLVFAWVVKTLLLKLSTSAAPLRVAGHNRDAGGPAAEH